VRLGDASAAGLVQGLGHHTPACRLQLIDIDDRHRSYPSQLAADLLLSRQAVHHRLAAMEARGSVAAGEGGGYIRAVVLTPIGRDLASRGMHDLAPLLDRIARLPGMRSTHSTLTTLERASRPPLPPWPL
jgi:hypothetical protein